MKPVSAKSKLFPVAGDARHDRVTANLRLQASWRLSGWPQENVLAVRSSGWFRLDGGRHLARSRKSLLHEQSCYIIDGRIFLVRIVLSGASPSSGCSFEHGFLEQVHPVIDFLVGDGERRGQGQRVVIE